METRREEGRDGGRDEWKVMGNSGDFRKWGWATNMSFCSHALLKSPVDVL